jgi:hypothetical protein
MKDGARSTRARTWSWLYLQLLGDGNEETDEAAGEEAAESAASEADGTGE